MDIEKRHANNLEKIVSNFDNSDIFGVSKVQRLCECGYNEAITTLEYGVLRGRLTMTAERPFNYRVLNPD